MMASVLVCLDVSNPAKTRNGALLIGDMDEMNVERKNVRSTRFLMKLLNKN